jgi:AcrR family transcriptional regulator
MSVLAHRTYLRAGRRRDQILDCALEVFSRKGFHAASIADICARAGIGRATLYQYFQDKRDVLVALADRIAQRVIDAAALWPRFTFDPEALPTRHEAAALMEARCTQILDAAFTDGDTARLLLRAARGCDGLVDATLQRIDEHIVGVVEADVRAALAIGAIRPCDPHLVALFIVGSIEKAVLAALDEDRTVDPAHISREAVLFASYGLYNRPSSPEDPPAEG